MLGDLAYPAAGNGRSAAQLPSLRCPQGRAFQFPALVSTWGVESTIAEFAIAQARLNFMDSQGWGTNPSLQSQYDALDARVAELQMQLMYLAMPDLAQQLKQTNPGVGLP